ncbi:nickel transporter [Cohaesibacter celericrescens]|uniref:Nickel/cobalt efflux system n=2 Tax=Cohaesibacter celericrescens TaxID=2067669 RepID=A0A2N5XL87_9HYPH|nr:nickel transporter [Cohaesibacter celericrescens]
MRIDMSERMRSASIIFAVILLATAMVLLAGFLPGAEAFATKSPFGVALPETTGPLMGSGVWGDIQGWILARQSEFYMALKDAVKLVEGSWAALGALLGLSFAYGAFHAAGPGHGKVVLTTYLFASGATARKGALLALIAAMVQASVAVFLIGIAAVALNLTAVAITQTAQLLELASYGMFVLLGLWLLLRAWRAYLSVRALGNVANKTDSHAHTHSHVHGPSQHHDSLHIHEHKHDHAEGCGCGHSHAPALELVEEAHGMRGMALAVVSMGLRPCSGALIVLVFALSQKVFWAGVLAAYAMGLGTGLTIAMLALVAAYARSFSQTLAERGMSHRMLDWFGAAVLLLAGLVVLGFGLVLLLANLL